MHHTLQLICAPGNGVDSNVWRILTALILKKKEATTTKKQKNFQFFLYKEVYRRLGGTFN